MDLWFFFALGTVCGITILIECTMWILFKNRIAKLVFPHHADASMTGFFTVARMLTVVTLHAIVLLALFLFAFFLLW